MLIINNLTVSYNSNNVLNNCSFKANIGETLGIIGLNGAGKSTLFNAMFGFVKPETGSMLLHNNNLTRKDISYLETNNFFYSGISGEEHLSIFPKNNTILFEKYVSKFQLPLQYTVDEYSTGMKKKLAILGLLLLDRPIVIFDEPYNGLDLESAYYLTQLIYDLQVNDKIILISSHIMESLYPVCNRIAWLNNKNIDKIFEKEEFSSIEKVLFATN